MSACSAMVAYQRARRPFVSGMRAGIHLLTFSTMVGLASIILLSNHSLESSQAYAWFLAHWPYDDQGWGIVFAASAAVGALEWVGGGGLTQSHDWASGAVSWFRRRRILRFLSAVALGAGHMTFAHGVWEVNKVAAGAAIYSILAGASVVAIGLAILEDW